MFSLQNDPLNYYSFFSACILTYTPLLMSLWNVDDQATQILMAEFYRNYVVGESKTTALKLAQKKVKETPGFEDPKYWAAFVLLDGIDD
ncbi:MAG: CHAT domain-containing protein [Bacteroidales bacterium]|nr:CHAT domain-containing protein [Bacteroidales bacterium]